MANLDNIVAPLRAAGLNVVETAGWITRGYAGQDLAGIRGVLWHHTATASARNASSGNMPTLNVLINGHSGLAGPLCNIGLGRDGTVYMIATGVANHAGTGVAPNIPRNMGNHYLIGIEMESSGTAPWDWTAAQLKAAPILGATLERLYLMGLPADLRLQMGHLEYSDAGKTDPAGWPGGMDGLRNSINAILNGTVKPAPTPVKPKPAPVKPKPAPSKPAPSKHGANDPRWVVKKGDTLRKISNYYYGDGNSVNLIAKYNGISDVNSIKVGQTIYLPGPLYWVVELPDTYTTIANYYGFDPDYIARLNGDRDRNSEIYVGNHVKIF